MLVAFSGLVAGGVLERWHLTLPEYSAMVTACVDISLSFSEEDGLSILQKRIPASTQLLQKWWKNLKENINIVQERSLILLSALV